MIKRLAFILFFLCPLLITSAYAAPNDANQFIRSKTYSGQFSDLSPDSPFYDNVSALYEYGLSVGKPDGTYGLQDTLTVGQAVIFAGRIRSLYRTGDTEAGPAAYVSDGQDTATPYLLYLQAEGVLDTALDDQLSSPATRAQMAHVLAGILPDDVLSPINNAVLSEGYASRRFVQDVTEYTAYYQDILWLYRYGICQGTDASGSYLPDELITRGATAAMLTRMMDPALQISLQWDLSYTIPDVQGLTLADLVVPAKQITAPQTEAEMHQAIRHMLSSGSNELKLQYPELSSDEAQKVMDSALAVVKSYCEQSYNSTTCVYTLDGTVTLTFSAAGAGDRISHYRDTAMEIAIAVHDELWSNATITPFMSDYEKAKAYYTWICENCVYDDDVTEESLSHIAYGLFHDGTAVCDGYTGAYNMLLKLEGIACSALSNSSHIWTVAMLDGKEYHIDTTWGDSRSEISYAYFGMSPEMSWRYHPW